MDDTFSRIQKFIIYVEILNFGQNMCKILLYHFVTKTLRNKCSEKCF